MYSLFLDPRLAHRCSPPLVVRNVVVAGPVTCDLDDQVTLTCLPYHQFPDGSPSKVIRCDQDQQWAGTDDILHGCQSKATFFFFFFSIVISYKLWSQEISLQCHLSGMILTTIPQPYHNLQIDYTPPPISPSSPPPYTALLPFSATNPHLIILFYYYFHVY